MSLAKCLIDFPVDPDDLAKIKSLIKDGDEGKAVEKFARQLDKELSGLRKQLIDKGHGVEAPLPKSIESPAKTPLTAEMKRMVSESNDEGFDPETGTHDLEPEIDLLREQNALMPDEVAALKAADETHEAVGAWEEVMNLASFCVKR